MSSAGREVVNDPEVTTFVAVVEPIAEASAMMTVDPPVTCMATTVGPTEDVVPVKWAVKVSVAAAPLAVPTYISIEPELPVAEQERGNPKVNTEAESVTVSLQSGVDDAMKNTTVSLAEMFRVLLVAQVVGLDAQLPDTTAEMLLWA